jgi:L-ascorbate 6-phosphate lactonase
MKADRPRGRHLIDEINRTTLPPDAVGLWYLGQSGFVVKGDQSIIYLDPYLSDFLEQYTRGRPDEDPRHFHPPLSPEDVTNADLLFGSHCHFDHIDPGAVMSISQSSPQCQFVVPPVARDRLLDLGIGDGRIVTVPVDQEQTARDVTFISVPAAHEDLDYDPDHGYPYRGYVITVSGITLYHAGDCIPYDGLVEKLTALNVDVVLLPINGRDYFRSNRGFPGNFTYREAAELTVAIGADLLIPMHFGMHLANTEHPGYLVDCLADHFPQQKYHIMTVGERLLYLRTGEDGQLAIPRG